MKDFENLPEAIFDLLARKKYSELTELERLEVDVFMSEEEFDSYRNIVLDFQELDTNLPLKKSTSKKEKNSVLEKIWNYPIPLYQVAAVFLLFALATFAVPLFEKNNEVENIVESENQEKSVGKSLANDEYPEELVFNF